MSAERHSPQNEPEQPKRTRRRAVRLTVEASERLEAALVERWTRLGSGKRMTRAWRAAQLGLTATSTAEKVLRREGVDRQTLVIACQSLGLKWRDSMCEPATNGESPEPEAAAVPEPQVSQADSRRIPWRRFVAVAAVVLVAMLLPMAGAIRWEARHRGLLADRIRIEEEFQLAHFRADRSYESGDYRAARAQSERAIGAARKLGRTHLLAVSTGLYAQIATAEGRYEEALEAFENVLSLHRSNGNTRSVAPVLEMIGDLETRLGRYASAERNLLASLEGYRRDDDPGGMAMALRDLGTVAYETGRLELADRRFREALAELRIELDTGTLITDIQARRALVVARLGRIDEARQVLRAALEYWRKRGHLRWVATTTFQLAQVEIMGKNCTEARRLLDSARTGYLSVGDLGGAERCRKGLTQIESNAKGGLALRRG